MNENKGSLGIVVVLMTVVILGFGGYLIYDKILPKSADKTECPKCEVKDCENNVSSVESKSLSGKYSYSGTYSVADMIIDLELKSDNTFVLDLSYAAEGGIFKGIYTLYGNALKLYAESEPASNASLDIKESADTFDCTYDATNDKVVINKWNKISTEGQNIKREIETKFNQTLSKKN